MATASTTEDIHKSLKALTTCPICQDIYVNPKVLSCQHTFCKRCVRQYYTSYNEDRLVKMTNFPCPQCRKTIYLTTGGLEGLPNDRKVQELLDFMDRLSITSKTKTDVCDICLFEKKQVNASNFCIHCSKYFCSTCKGHHEDNALFRSHSLMDITSSDLSVLECSEHKEEIKYFCKTCNTLLCTVCAIGNHARHNTSTMDEALEDKRKVFQVAQKQLQVHAAKFEKKVTELTELKEQRAANMAEVQKSIQKQRARLEEMLQKQECSMLAQVETCSLQDNQRIDKDIRYTKQQVSNMQKLAESATRMLAPNKSLELLASHDSFITNLTRVCEQSLPDTLSELLKLPGFTGKDNVTLGKLVCQVRDADEVQPVVMEPEDKLHYHSPNKVETGAPRSTGSGVTTRVSTSPQIPKRSTGGGSPSSSGRMKYTRVRNQVSSPPLTKATRPISPMTRPASPKPNIKSRLLWKTQEHFESRGAAFLSDGSIIVAEYKDGSDKVKLFDSSGNLEKCLSAGPFNMVKPWGVAVNQVSHTIMVTDQGDSSVKVLDADLGVTNVWRRMFQKPSGVGVLRNGEYVVSDPAGTRHKVSIHMKSGVRIQEFGSHGANEGQLICPNYLAVDQQDRIIISDCENHCVQIFDRNGRHIRKFTHTGRQAWIPQGVAITPTNHILIADQGQCNVRLYSSDGQYIQQMVEVDSPPWGVACHKDGMVAVTTNPSLLIHQITFTGTI